MKDQPETRMLVTAEVKRIRATLNELLDELLLHNGYGHLDIDLKILNRKQKEVLIRSGKEYRFVVDFMNERANV